MIAAQPLLLALTAVALVALLAPQEPGFVVRHSGAPLSGLLQAESEEWERSLAVTWGPAPYPTEFRALYTSAGLAVRFAAVDDAPWHTLGERDDPIWNEEVVEIFIDPDGDGRNYVEIELNPAGVVCDLQIFAAGPPLRSAISWDFAGLETRVSPLRDGAGTTVGWTVTATLPWAGFAALDDTAVTLPPVPGDRWKFNVFRIKRPGGPGDPERGVILAPWSPTPGPSFHAPAAFRDLVFGAAVSGR